MSGPIGRASLVLFIGFAAAAVFGFIPYPAVVADLFGQLSAAVGPIGDPAAITAETLRGVMIGWDRTPAIAIAIASALTVPMMAYAVRIVRTAQRRRDENRDRATAPHFSGSIRSPMTRAWIELGGAQGRRLELAREIVRIGQGSDSDVRLPGHGLDAVHALIRRTPESEYVIMDMSGGKGPGVAVNGQRRATEHLRDGDTIALGNYSMTFHRAAVRDGLMLPRG
jgi:Inner membrane component of T3SS, cytoplasmic domain